MKAYVDGLSSLGGSDGGSAPADPKRIAEICEEQVAYWVQGEVRTYVYAFSGEKDEAGFPVPGERVLLRKKATYDPIVDGDPDTGDWEEEWLDD